MDLSPLHDHGQETEGGSEGGMDHEMGGMSMSVSICSC